MTESVERSTYLNLSNYGELFLIISNIGAYGIGLNNNYM